MEIREMTTGDVEFAFSCTRDEGWVSETRDSFDAFLAHDPSGCLVAEVDARPAGICVATRYRKTGFIGELVVIKELRGRGIGKRLFSRAIRYLRSSGVSSICLDGDPEAVPLYERMGFRKVCRSLRFVGDVEGMLSPAVRRVRGEDAEGICALDRELFGDDRGHFIRRRLQMYPDLCFVSEEGGALAGYVLARPGIGVASVGPWASRSSDAGALSLVEAIAACVAPLRLRVGVLESNLRAVGLLRSVGSWEETRPCWRMVLGPDERLGIHEDLLAVGSAAKG